MRLNNALCNAGRGGGDRNTQAIESTKVLAFPGDQSFLFPTPVPSISLTPTAQLRRSRRSPSSHLSQPTSRWRRHLWRFLDRRSSSHHQQASTRAILHLEVGCDKNGLGILLVGESWAVSVRMKAGTGMWNRDHWHL